MSSAKFISFVQDHKEWDLLPQERLLCIVRDNRHIVLSNEIPCFLIDFFCILIF